MSKKRNVKSKSTKKSSPKKSTSNSKKTNTKKSNSIKTNINTKDVIISKIRKINIKKLIIFTIIVILLLGVFLLVRGNYNKHNDNMNELEIRYSDNKLVKFNKFEKDFSYSKTITITNTGKENKTYSLEWIKVKNSLKNQSNFLYEIKCTGNRCATLGKSQVPTVGFVVYQQALIEPGVTQKYEVKFTYKGKEKDASFKGILQVYSEKEKEETEIEKTNSK